MAIEKLTKEAEEIILKEKDSEARRRFIALKHPEIDVPNLLIKILKETDNPSQEGFSISWYKEGNNKTRKVFIYSISLRNPFNNKDYCFVKTQRGYEEWPGPKD
jgi:hypothetical protein